MRCECCGEPAEKMVASQLYEGSSICEGCADADYLGSIAPRDGWRYVTEAEMIAHCEKYRVRGMASADYRVSKFYGAQWHANGAWRYWQAKGQPARAAFKQGVYLANFQADNVGATG